MVMGMGKVEFSGKRYVIDGEFVMIVGGIF